MKRITKLTWLMFLGLILSFSSFAQTTEDFETDVVGATTFDDNGQNFTITNGAGETNYDIETFAGGGWNGTGPDNNFVDNSGTPTPTLGNGSSFTITTTNGTDIYLNNFYLFVSQFNLSAASGFSVTIQARRNGVLQYTVTKSSGFSNTSTFTPNNGFTFFDFTTLGGSDNSNTPVDELTISSTANADYLALDGFNWEFAPSCVSPTVPTVTATTNPLCSGSSTTLNIAGALNDATEWNIYTGFCGVTNVGTTSGSTFVVSPTSTTSYYIRGEGGCVLPGTCGAITITVNAAEDASFSYGPTTYCVDDGDPTPTISGAAGGTFVATTPGLSLNASDGMIDLSASTPGTYTVEYTTSGACPGTADQNITINALDDASFNYSAASYCADDTDPTPSITGLGSGTFSSGAGLAINASTGVIDLSISTPGTYTVSYTTTGPCPNSSSVSVTVNALDNAAFNYSAAGYCPTDVDPTPTITGLSGGAFSSTAGLSLNGSTGVIDLSASTPGTYTVTYTTTGSCPNSSSVAVTVNVLDDASFNYSAAAYCINDTDPTPTITGVSGGSFSSGAGLSINASTGVIDLSASTPGTYTVTYSTSGPCPNNSSVSVTVNAADDASFNYSAAAYCADDTDPTPTITGLAGGNFISGPGLTINSSTGVIDLSASTPGAYTITYNTTGPCPNSASVSLTVNALDDASFFYSGFAHCANGTDPVPNITGLTGGTFSSTAGLSINASTGVVDLSASTPATYVITYTTAGTCPNSSSVTMAVNALDDASFSYSASSYCTGDSDPTPTITGVMSGSFASGAGLSINASNGTIDLSASTPGTYTVTYTTIGFCPNSSSVSVTVNASDDASFSYSASTYCSADIDPTPTITGLAGGAFSSTAGLSINASTGEVDLSASTAGTYTVTYTTSGSCPNSSSVSITVTGLDDASFSYSAASYCSTGPDPAATITGVAGGTFSSTAGLVFVNTATGEIDLSASTLGTYTVTYSTSGSCANSSTQSVTITTVPTAPVPVTPTSVCPGDDVILTATGSGTGSINFYDDNMVLAGSVAMPPATAVLNAGTLPNGMYSGFVTEENGGCESLTAPYSFMVGDTTDPTAVCQDITIYIDGSGAASIVAGDIDGGSTDNCGPVTVTASQTAFDCSDIGGSPAGTLIITGAYDAGLTGGTPKGVELYVANDIADLSQYGIGSANNGGGTDGEEFTFPAVSVTAGTYIYVASESTQFTNFFGFAPDYTDGAMGINGDDAVELFHMGSVIDVFGDINVDGTGQPWDFLDGWAYRNSGTGPDGSTFTLGSWSFSGINVFDSQTTNATTPTPLPIGTFTPATVPGTPVTLTVTDGSGNTADCVANVTVLDTLAPVASCQDIAVFLDGSGNASIVAADLDNGSSDNCSTVTLAASPTAFTCANVGANTVTLTVTDGSGNTSTCTSTVTVSDSIAPVASCQDLTVFLDGSGNASIVASDLDNGSSDNCGTVTLAASPTTFTCANIGANTVTLTVTDGDGNTSTCTSTVTVSDTTAPVASCQDITVFLDGSGNASIVAADLDNGSSDNCSAVTLAASPTAFTCADIGANTVTLTVTDGSGNTATCTSTVTVSDSTAPIASCQDITVFLDGSGNASIVAADLDNGSSDNCSTVTLAASSTAFTCANVGANTVTLTVTDGSGNTSTCTSTVTVSDSTSPTAVCQDITVFLDASGNASITAADIDGGSSDNCGTVTFAAVPTTFTCANVGANTVTLTVTDGSGNTATCSATVTVSDTVSPVVTCPGDITEVASATCDFTLLDYTAMASGTDACGTVTLTQSPAAGTTITADQVVTITADDGNGNTSTCTFNILLDVSGCAGIECANAIVVDPLDPCGDTETVTGSTVGGTPNTESFFCGTSLGSGGANWYTFTGDGGDWTASTLNPGSNYDTKLWVYEGACAALNCVAGNDDFGGTSRSQVSFATTAGATYYVVVGGFSANEGNYELTLSNVETVAPVITCPGDQSEPVSATCDFTIPDYTALPIATDNCGTPTVTQSPAAGTVITADQVITMTATDAAGNSSTCTFNVILTGATPPVAVCQDVTIYLDGAGNASIVASDIDGGSSSTCGTPSLSASTTAFTCAELGTNNVTLTVTDAGGNTDDCIAVVTVVDTLAPTPDVATLADVTGECAVTVLVDPSATDNCGTVTVTNDATLPIATQGITVVTWTYDDGNGNTSTQTQNVVVNDVSSPLPTAAPLPDVIGECSVDVMPTAPTAIDACTGAITGVETSGTTFPITTQGTTVLVWEFDDGNGNITTQTQNIVVNDVTGPAPDVATLADLTGDCSIDTPVAPTATDNCAGTITGTTTTTFPITAIGTTTIVWEFDDGNGNITTQTQDAVNSGIDATATLSADGGTITANTAGATYEWLNCDFGTTVAGETGQSFTPATNGNYAVVVTVGNCSDTSACENVSTAGIDVLSIDQLSVYPNPSESGFFTVKYDGTIEAIDVVDMLGRVIVLPTDVTTGLVDGSELAQGRYMVRVTTDKAVLTTEVVIAQ